MGLRYRYKATFNFEHAKDILAKEFGSEFNSLGDTLKTRVRSNMKDDTGEEKRNVKKKVTQFPSQTRLTVSGNLVQTNIDEYGRPPGKFPPFHKGSKLYAWVGRKGFVGASSLRTGKRTFRFSKRTTDKTGLKRTAIQSGEAEQRTVTFIIARNIAKKGIKPNKPFERALNNAKSDIDSAVNRAVSRFVSEINS